MGNKMRINFAGALVVAAMVVGWFSSGIPLVAGEVGIGTATSYQPSYPPTKCNVPIPENGMFVAVSEGIWAGGATCGQKYLISCLDGPNNPCKNETIIATVVDVCPTNPCPANFLLPENAISSISKFPNAEINVEYKQL